MCTLNWLVAERRRLVEGTPFDLSGGIKNELDFGMGSRMFPLQASHSPEMISESKQVLGNMNGVIERSW